MLVVPFLDPCLDNGTTDHTILSLHYRVFNALTEFGIVTIVTALTVADAVSSYIYYATLATALLLVHSPFTTQDHVRENV
jgi:hypothetical protein